MLRLLVMTRNEIISKRRFWKQSGRMIVIIMHGAWMYIYPNYENISRLMRVFIL